MLQTDRRDARGIGVKAVLKPGKCSRSPLARRLMTTTDTEAAGRHTDDEGHDTKGPKRGQYLVCKHIRHSTQLETFATRSIHTSVYHVASLYIYIYIYYEIVQKMYK